MSVVRRWLVAVMLVAVVVPPGPAAAAPTLPDVSAAGVAPLWAVEYPSPTGRDRQPTGLAFDPRFGRLHAQAEEHTVSGPSQPSGVRVVSSNQDGTRRAVRDEPPVAPGESLTPKRLASDPARGVVYSLVSSFADDGYVTYLSAYGPSGPARWTVRYRPAGALTAYPGAVAVDPITGQVFFSVRAKYPSGSSYYYRAVTVAFSPTGQQVWETAHADGYQPDDVVVDAGRGVVYTAGGGYGVGFRVEATRTDGSSVWTFGRSIPLYVKDLAVDPTTGTVVLAGELGNLDVDWITLALSPGGRPVWNRTFAPGEGYDAVAAMAVDPVSGTVVITGRRAVPGGMDMQAVAYAVTGGALLWSDTFDGAAGYSDDGRDVVVDPDRGRVYVTVDSQLPRTAPNGSVPSEVVTIAYDLTGQRVRVDHFSPAPDRATSPWFLAVDPATGIVFVAATTTADLTGSYPVRNVLTFAYPPA